jgi:hypothetical protein
MCMTCSLRLLSLIFTTAIMDCRVGPRGVASVYCRVVYTWKRVTRVMRPVRKLWLCQVRHGLFVPKSSKDVAVIVFRLNISLSRDIAVSPFGS